MGSFCPCYHCPLGRPKLSNWQARSACRSSPDMGLHACGWGPCRCSRWWGEPCRQIFPPFVSGPSSPFPVVRPLLGSSRSCKRHKPCTTHAKRTIYAPMRMQAFVPERSCKRRKKVHHARETDNLCTHACANFACQQSCAKRRKMHTTHAKRTMCVPMRANFACRQDCTGRKRGHHARETSNLALECPPTLRADKAMQTTQNARAARELSNSDAKLCVPGSLAKDPNGARRRGNGQFGCKNLRPNKAMHVTESCTPQGKRIIWMQKFAPTLSVQSPEEGTHACRPER